MSLTVISELKYLIVFLPTPDPPMSEDMEQACDAIIRMELGLINASLSKTVYTQEYHLITITAAPGVAPLNIAEILKRNISRGLMSQFKELGNWGELYYEAILIKSGSRIGEKKISEFIDIAINGI